MMRDESDTNLDSHEIHRQEINMDAIGIEMTLFESAKVTENKLRWDVEVNGVTFSLYIPKWRVPRPWPSRICVRITPRRNEGTDEPNLSSVDATNDPVLTHEPIIATVTMFKKHTNTIRYRPVGEAEKWEIGEPYIPFSLTADATEKLRLIVFWDISSRGAFGGRQLSDTA